MKNLKNLKLTPHPSYFIFRKHKIHLGVVAQSIDLSYPYLCNLLRGIRRPTQEVDAKLNRLAQQLEDRRS